MGKRYPTAIQRIAKQNQKKLHCPRNSEWQKPSASIFTLSHRNWQQIQDSGGGWGWVVGWGVWFFYLFMLQEKKFSEHFVRKKSLTQETWINRDCNNLCCQRDGPGLPPSCITGNPPKEAFWTKRFSRAWSTNCVTKITGNLLQCSANILQETWKFPCLVQNKIPRCSAILFFPRPGCWTNPNTASSPRWYH